MNKIKTLTLIALFSASLVLADTGTRTESTPIADGFLAAGDVALVRPVSTAATIGAFGIFVVIAPFTEMAVDDMMFPSRVGMSIVVKCRDLPRLSNSLCVCRPSSRLMKWLTSQ